MARTHARIYAAIWQDADFIALPAEAQRVYMLALSQPGVSFCGVVSFTARRWSNMAGDSTPESIRAAVAVLETHGFVVVDEDAEELWIRSFVRHDGVLESPNLVKRMWRDVPGIFSASIRDAFLSSLPEDAWIDESEGIAKPSARGTGNPSDNPSPTPVPIPVPSPVPNSSSVELALVSPPATACDPVAAVFLAWQHATGHHKAILDTKRKRCIAKALKHYPLEDCIDACRGVVLSPHHRGENDTRTVYDDIELVLRDSAHIEKFRDLARGDSGPAPPKLPQNAESIRRAVAAVEASR